MALHDHRRGAALMLSVGALAFLNPWLLAALALLPALWLLLRALPPSPARIAFPGVRLLLGLDDPEKTPHRTPWWLLLLRLAIAAAVILAFADPVLNPRERTAATGPAIVVMDGGWASAPDWDDRREAALAELDRAERDGRAVSFVLLSAPPPSDFALDIRPAAGWRGAVEAASPAPWAPLRAEWAAAFEAIADAAPTDAEAIWITDGLAHGDEGATASALSGLGALRVVLPVATARGLSAPRLDEGRLTVAALRAETSAAETTRIGVFGRTETGERRLATVEAVFAEDAATAEAEIDLPLELRNQISRVALIGGASAGGAALTDESVRRRRVGLVSAEQEDTGLRLVSNLHYLRTALARNADVVEGGIEELLATNPDALAFADIGRLTPPEREALEGWIAEGGLLIRFAGPRLARGADLAAGAAADETLDDPLLPVRLRGGGRAVGGAMAWGAPQAIRDFGRESPFFGLDAPREVTVSRQILARLGPDLAEKTWAALEDGTPLVTAAPYEAGRVVLFHVTANAEWSSLPLSGLFVDMMRRLIAISGGGGSGEAPPPHTPMRQVAPLDAFGAAAPAAGDIAQVTAAR
ncbi:MAG: BatA domain-containing protein, partial [Pseudomonadota bacterium]